MAAALFRGRLCLRCIHSELCRVVWRPQAAQFSSKPSDRKQPRRTHIKKAKPQPAVDIATLLEHLFSQRRPGTAPPPGKVRPSKVSSVSTKPPTTSSVEVPLLKTEPAASSLKQVHSVPKKTTPIFNTNIETATEPVELKTASALPLSEKNIETSSFSAASAAEPLIETTTESPVEPSLFPVETLKASAAVAEGPADHILHALDEEVQNKGTDSRDVPASTAAIEEPLTETDSSVEESHSSTETLETEAAAVEGPVDVTADTATETKSTNSRGVDISHTATFEPLVETRVEPSLDTSTFPLNAPERRDPVVEGSAQTTIEAEADAAAQATQTHSTDSGVVKVSYCAKEEPSVETTIEPAVSEGTVKPAVEDEAATALSQKAQESAPLPLKNEEESTVESSSGNVTVEEGVNKSEQMTLESVTLHMVKTLVESLKTDELIRTTSALDEEAEKRLQELLVQMGTGAEYKTSAEAENSSEDEAEILTKSLSKWDSLPEDLQQLEGQGDMLVKELLCRVPAALSRPPGRQKTSSASGPHAGAKGKHVEEKGTEAEESVTLSKVKAKARALETEVLLETRKALEKEAEVLTSKERMEVKTMTEDAAVFEDMTEAEALTPDSVSEATDATEAEIYVILEAVLWSEQELRKPTDTLPTDLKQEKQHEAIDQEAEKECGEQERKVLEAMTLESVTLAEIEASLETLKSESLRKTTDHLEKEAKRREKRVEVEDGMVSEETTESLSLPEGDVLSEALQTDRLMEDLLCFVPGHVTEITEGPVCQEAARANILEDLDPVQRLFLEKIREYNNLRRLNQGLMEAEPDYVKSMSEETAKLQRLYGGGDLSSFPEFTFTEPEMDQDS